MTCIVYDDDTSSHYIAAFITQGEQHSLRDEYRVKGRKKII